MVAKVFNKSWWIAVYCKDLCVDYSDLFKEIVPERSSVCFWKPVSVCDGLWKRKGSKK